MSTEMTLAEFRAAVTDRTHRVLATDDRATATCLLASLAIMRAVTARSPVRTFWVRVTDPATRRDRDLWAVLAPKDRVPAAAFAVLVRAVADGHTTDPDADPERDVCVVSADPERLVEALSAVASGRGVYDPAQVAGNN